MTVHAKVFSKTPIIIYIATCKNKSVITKMIVYYVPRHPVFKKTNLLCIVYVQTITELGSMYAPDNECIPTVSY